MYTDKTIIMNKSITINWTTNNGHQHEKEYGSLIELENQRDNLEKLEAENQKWAPTDSGSVRLSRIVEHQAIMDFLNDKS